MMSDDYIKSWAHNNMNWVDIEPNAIHLPKEDKPYDYRKFWVSTFVEFVEDNE